MNNQEVPGASKKVDPFHDGSPAVFDPYFGKLPRDSGNFDTVTWIRAR